MRTFISLEHITREARAVIMRFPLAMAAALLGTIVGILFIEAGEPTWYIRLLMVLVLGFPLFVALVFLGEERQFGKNKKILASAAAIIFLAVYYFLLPSDIDTAPEANIIRFLLWAFGFVLLVTFISFLKKSEENSVRSFWQFNMSLVYSLVLTGVWAAAFQVGISIALASINFLFKLDIAGERYLELWIVIVGIFATTFFLSRVPRGFGNSSETEKYPSELRLFSQYVLVPLVALYFLILYAYVVRILVMWEWPEGTLAYMILGFSLLGIAVYVCLYPLRSSVPWVRRGGTIFFSALLPQVGMLFWALWFRISQYGFTENRYFVFVFGWWLLAMALYFLMSTKKDIRIIPITLFCIAPLSSFGPWGAFAVSERSQTSRLEGLLTKNNLLVNNKVQKTNGDVPLDDEKEISAILAYLHRTHGFDGIQKWFERNLEAPQTVAEELIGIEYVEGGQNTYFYFTAARSAQEVFPISNYEYMKMVEGVAPSTIEVSGAAYSFEIDNTKTAFVARMGNNTIIEVDLKLFLDNLSKQGGKEIDQNQMKIESKSSALSFVLYVNHIGGERKENNKYQIDSLDGTLLFSL